MFKAGKEGVENWKRKVVILSLDGVVLKLQKAGLHAERQETKIFGGSHRVEVPTSCVAKPFLIERDLDGEGWTVQVSLPPGSFSLSGASLEEAVAYLLKVYNNKGI